MKFIHVSDIHIGMTPDPMMPWANDRALDIRESFANVINKCKEENADLLLISGDLFNHQPLTEELFEVNSLFRKIPSTKVLIVAGSSDYIKTNSPILNFNFAPNVHYFLNPIPEECGIKDSKVIIHGFSYYNLEETSPIIDTLIPDKDDNVHILLCYGGDSRHCPIDINKIEKRNFSYVALGSNHKFQAIVDNKIYYAGSLEPLSSQEEGDHGIIIGEIDDNTKRISNIKFEKIAKAAYLPIRFKINGNTTEDEIVEEVTREVIKNGSNNIYKIVLYGMRNPDIDFSIDMFNKRIRISDFIDNTEPKYDFIKLSAEHPQDMIGAFIRKMNKDNSELSDIEKKALYLGTQALLKTSNRSNN